MNIFRNTPLVVRNLIVINVIMLAATWLVEQAGNDFMIRYFALFYPASPLFQPWQFVTHMFMHGGVWHLAFNMYALWMFGSSLEYQWGSKKFLFFYFVTGIGAALFYSLVLWIQLTYTEAPALWFEIMRTPMVGASGAVYGVLLGFGMLFPDVRLQFIFPPVSLRAKWAVIIFGVLELALGISNHGGNIAHFAHVGGMVFALILIKMWKRKNTMYNYYGN